MVEFHARDAKVLKQQPFIPKPADKSPTKFDNFELHTELRKEQREEIDKQFKQREAENLAEKLRVCTKMFVL